MLDFTKLINVLTDDAFLYVNYPFCSDFCRYCIYKLHRYTDSDSEKFLQLYVKEIRLLSHELNGFKFKNIHIGGGTPNLVDPRLLIEPLRPLTDFDELSRFVVEVFPSNRLQDYLLILKAYNVTKIQLGVQTLNEDLLKQENRLTPRHTIMQCLDVLAKSGFLWSLDLIYGFDNEKEFGRDYLSELNTLLHYHPFGFHLYTVRSERANKFYAMKNKRNEKAFSYRNIFPGFDEYVNVQKYLITKGYSLIYDEYCIGSNVDHAQRAISYNATSGVFPNIIGIGLGAYSHTRVMRYRNVRNLADYGRLLDKNMMPIRESSDFSSNSLYPISMIYNQIRKGADVDLSSFSSAVNLSVEENMEINNMLHYLADEGVQYFLENSILSVPQSHYSLFLSTINEYVEKKSSGTYSFILD